MSSTVQLIRRDDGETVDAQLHCDLDPEQLVLIQEQWGPVKTEIRTSLTALGLTNRDEGWPQSLHWDWTGKSEQLRLLEATGFGIIADDQWQGAMLTKSATKLALLPEERGKPLVYVDYIETAPWNWTISATGQAGMYRGVGSVLFREAVAQSIEEGFGGRVGLHALPQAEQFYSESCFMTSLGPDHYKQDLVYFEMSRKQVKDFLEDSNG